MTTSPHPPLSLPANMKKPRPLSGRRWALSEGEARAGPLLGLPVHVRTQAEVSRLGSAASVSLATARSLAGDARRQLDLGQDPIEAKRLAEREAAADKARSMTFKECAEAYMAAHEPSWTMRKVSVRIALPVLSKCFS